MTVLGLDVSHWDKGTTVPLIDWTQANQIFKFVFLKSSERDCYRDTLFKDQWRAAAGHILRAPYHFFRNSVNAIKQAQLMIEMVNGDWGELPPVCDFEEDYASIKNLGSFLYEIEKASGRVPIIYTGTGYWTTSGGQTTAGDYYKRYPLWLAAYWYDRSDQFSAWYDKMMLQPIVLFPKPPKPWDKVTIWQWTARGKPEDVPGYPKGKLEVDFNLFNGSLVELQALSINVPPIIPPVVPPVIQTKTYKVTTIWGLRVRSAPSVTAPIVRTMFYGTRFEAIDWLVDGGYIWLKVQSGFAAELKMTTPSQIYAKLETT
jgi:GH25 family lysozyme M1 (1,4-beta-N-acetylmuramidase)